MVMAAAALPAKEPNLETVAPNEFFEILEESRADGDAVLIDVRTPGEYEAGHAPAAVNMDYYGADFREELDALDRDGTYFLYCRSGSRSSRVLAMMTDMGFKEVYDLAGGWSGSSRRLAEVKD